MVNKPWSQDGPYWVGCRVRFSGGRVPLTINLLNLPLFFMTPSSVKDMGATACDFEAADGNFHMEIPWLLPAVQQWSCFRKADVEMRKKLLSHTPDNMLLMLLAEKDDLPETNLFAPEILVPLPRCFHVWDIYRIFSYTFTINLSIFKPNVTKCG